MSTKGENIIKAFRFIQKFYSEIAQLFLKLDDLMEREGWDSARGNTTTSDVSKDIQKPAKWLPDGSFRLYENKSFANVRKGIIACYIHEKLKEPILILGAITYHKMDEAQDWDIWNLWFYGPGEKNVGLLFSEDEPKRNFIREGIIKKANLFAINLVDITNEEDIKNKVFKKLLSL